MKEWSRGLWTGVGIGALAVAALPFAIPVIAEVIRPLTKAVLRQGLLGGDRARTHAARLSEALQDLMAEVRVEVAQELEARSQAESGGLQVPPTLVEAAQRAQAKKVVS